jgi:hypothetical protein
MRKIATLIAYAKIAIHRIVGHWIAVHWMSPGSGPPPLSAAAKHDCHVDSIW